VNFVVWIEHKFQFRSVEVQMTSWEDHRNDHPFGHGIATRAPPSSPSEEDSDPEERERLLEPVLTQMSEDIAATVAERAMTVSQKAFIESGNNPRILMRMCMGLKDKEGVRELANFDGEDPVYGSLPDKASCNPTVPMLKVEARRRAAMYKMAIKASTVSRPALVEFLKDNPIANCLDEDWLRNEEAKIYDIASRALEEQNELAAARLKNSNWNVPQPWLRLYLCVCHDRARQALMNKDRTKDRDELDCGAGHSEERPLTLEEVVAELYNDDSVVLTTESLPGLHQLFAEPMVLKFSEMPGGEMTAEDVKARMGDARGKVVQVSTHGILCFFSFTYALITLLLLL